MSPGKGNNQKPFSLRQMTAHEIPFLAPDQRGFFGAYGGRYVPELLLPNLVQLEKVFLSLVHDVGFWQEFLLELQSFSGRPTPVTFCANVTRSLGGAQIYLKREDLSQTGAHKINNVIGQGLLMRRLGKRRAIAETGAGQHGIATATMAARFGFEACIYMGAEDVERQRPNVFWMERLGAKVIPVEDGSRTLKDAINEAMRDWSGSLDSSHYVLGTACGPHPFPMMVAFFQQVIGLEAREQIKKIAGKLPAAVYGCVGGGSNALGLFQGFLADKKVELVGVEAGGIGFLPGQHAARLAEFENGESSSKKAGTCGIAQGYETIFLQNEEGQMLDTHSVAAGLDYVGVSPILAHLADAGQVRMTSANDREAISALEILMREEGIIAAMESSHALAAAFREAPSRPSTDVILINLSGRGDKDIFTIAQALGDESWGRFLQKKAEQIGRGRR